MTAGQVIGDLILWLIVAVIVLFFLVLFTQIVCNRLPHCICSQIRTMHFHWWQTA